MNKIAHISITYDPNIASGILSNAKAKFKALRELDIHNFDFYLINDFISSTEDNIKLVKLSHNNFISEYFYKIFNKSKLISQAIDLDKYDIIIIRYPFADASLLKLVNNRKIYFEFHSVIIEDLKSYFKFSNPHRQLMFLNGTIRYFLERIYSKKIYDNTCGFMPVTDEINYCEAKRTKNKNFITISNGIDTSEYSKCNFRKFDGKNLNMIMISSMESYWHGIERLIASIDNYTGDININFYIVGHFPSSDYKFKNPKYKIILLGKKIKPKSAN